MAIYCITMSREDDQPGIEEARFRVPEDMYALVWDVVTGRIRVQRPEQKMEAVQASETSAEKTE